MSISVPAKVALGTLAGGATATGGALAYRGIFQSKEDSIKSKKSVSELIKTLNKDKRLIAKTASGDSAEWKATGKLYATAYRSKDENPFSLTQEKPQSELSGSESAPKEFMDRCESIAREGVDDESDSRYQNVLKYCTRDALVRDLILESGRVLFEGDGGKQGGQNYASSNSKDGEDAWKLSDGSTKKNERDYISEALKSSCNSKLDSKTKDGAGDDYQNVVNGCSKAQ